MFDRYVVAQTKVSWKRRALMIASIGLHAVAGIVLLVWSFFHVEEIAPPTLSLTFFAAPPPPPPPPPPAAHKKSSEVKKPVEHKMVQPTEVPKIVQPKEEEKPDEKDEGEPNGEEGGVKGGVQGGQKGGVVGSTGTGGGQGPAPKTVAGFTLVKDQLTHPQPHLPEWFTSQHAHQQFRATYKVCLRQDGHVSDVSVLTPIPGGIDQSVIEQIKSGWTYKPQPVPVCFPAVVVFNVN